MAIILSNEANDTFNAFADRILAAHGTKAAEPAPAANTAPAIGPKPF